MSNNFRTPLPKKMWLNIILFGAIGQIAWSVENFYFNLYIYNTIARDTDAVTLMVQLSGVVATLATILMGALSDKTGNRKRFISFGYVCWGISVCAFAFISKSTTASLFGITEAKDIVSVTIALVIIADCVMTFFGSTANDAAFNAYVTDNTDETNRGATEGILSIFPLLSMLVVVGGFGIIVESLGYVFLFLMIGGIMLVAGLIGIFTVKDSKNLLPDANGFKDILHGFKPSVMKNNKILYLIFAAFGLYGIASQVYMPFLIIYMEHYLGFTVMEYSLVLGIVIAVSSLIVVFLSRLTDKIGRENFTFISLALFIAGLLGIYFAQSSDKTTELILMGITGTVMIVGYILLLVVFGALVRDYTPSGNVGRFQGVRMVFYVLIPMFIGPMIGNAVNHAIGDGNSTLSYVDATTGVLCNTPVKELFLVAAILALLIAIPTAFFVKMIREDKKKREQPIN